MEKIKKGDDVIVTAGRDKGKRGTVLRIVDARHLVVEGVNRVKKHQRPNRWRTGARCACSSPTAKWWTPNP